jgi:hypothetical protein
MVIVQNYIKTENMRKKPPKNYSTRYLFKSNSDESIATFVLAVPLSPSTSRIALGGDGDEA